MIEIEHGEVELNQPRRNFSVVDNRIHAAHDISPEARYLWCWMAHHREGFKLTGTFIEKAMGCGSSRRQRMQRELVDAGWLEIKTYRSEDGSFDRHGYLVLIPEPDHPPQAETAATGYPLPPMPLPADQAQTSTKKKNKNEPQELVVEDVTTVDGGIDDEEQSESPVEELQRLRSLWTPACPDVKGRSVIPRAKRMSLPEFEDLSVRYCAKSFAHPGGRAIVTLAFYSVSEVKKALEATSLADRPCWRYFKAALEGQSSGQTRATQGAPTTEELREYEFILAKPRDARSEDESAIVDKVKAWKAKGAP